MIVYGFKAGDLDLLLREFQKCGGILQHGVFGAPASANWVYLQFEVRNLSTNTSRRHSLPRPGDREQAVVVGGGDGSTETAGTTAVRHAARFRE